MYTLLRVLAPAALLAAALPGLTAQSTSKPAPKRLKLVDQGAHDPRLKGYVVPEGVKVEIVAEHPVVTDPVALTFAADGSLYVVEVSAPGKKEPLPITSVELTYKDGTKRRVRMVKKPVKDRVKVLIDSKGAGVYDQAKTVLEDDTPSSLLAHDGWLYVSGHGTVRRYWPSKPGGPYDKKEVVAQGFGGFGPHQASGLTLGHDGWLYVTCGDGDNVVEGSDGSRATVLGSGAVLRCRPNGSKLHVFALGFRNPYRDIAFDAAGNAFSLDVRHEGEPETGGCRLLHVPEGADFGWRTGPGPRPAAGVMKPLLRTGSAAPAGLLIHDDTRFPERFRGLLFYPDTARRLVRAYRVEAKGATFGVVQELDFLKSGDPLFRPCQMAVGPDGAIYLCDARSASGEAYRIWGEGKAGRIYRITWAGTKKEPALPRRGMDAWAKLGTLSDADLLKVLASEDLSDRQRARDELARRGPRNRKALLEIVQDGQEPARARVEAIGALQAMWDDEVAGALGLLVRDREPDVRRLAADALGLCSPAKDRAADTALTAALSDEEPAVRRAVFLALGRIGAPTAADTLVGALPLDDGKDASLRDGLVRAIEALGKPGIDRLLGLADSGVDADRDRVVEVFQALGSRPAYDALQGLLKNPHLTVTQTAGLVRSFGNYRLDPPVSLAPVVVYLDAREEAVQRAAVQTLGARPAGAMLVGERLLAGRLPPALRPLVAEALRAHALDELLKAVNQHEKK